MFEPFSSSLWHWLHNVMPRHPLHWTRFGKPRLSFGREWLYRGISSLLPLVLFINTGGLLFTPVTYLILVMIPLVLVNAFAGVMTTASITGAINRERERGRYELMGLMPSGMIGAGWVLTVRQMRNNLHILYMKQLALRCYVGVFLMLMIVLLGYWADYFDLAVLVRNRLSLMITVLPALNGFVLFGMLCLDYLQSLVGAALMGMVIPTFTDSRLEGLLYSLTGFLLMQVLIYLAVTLVWISAGILGLGMGLAPAILALLTLFVLREITNFAMLRLLMWRANADPTELAVTLRSGL